MADIEKIQPIGDTEQYTLRARTDSKGNVITDYYLPLKTAGGLKENSGGGSSSYFKLATLVITGGYVNRPIVFELSRRGYGFQKLEIMFANNSTNDPNLNYIRTDGEDLGFWINKTATSTWEVYGRYNESYGSCTVHRITGSATNNGVTVTLNLENIGTTQPEGTQARRGYSAKYADIAVTLDSNAGSSTVPIYFSGGKPVQCSTTLGVSITGNAATATKLATARTIWGQSFDGSGNVTGHMYNMGPQVRLPEGETRWQFLTSGGGAGNGYFGKIGLSGSYATIDSNLGSYYLYVNGKSRFDQECVNVGNSPYGSFRFIGGNYGAFIRNDGSDTYILLTNSGDQYGQWNGLRPFRINNSSGYTYFTRGYGAVWNDYAEFRKSNELEPGRCIVENGDGSLSRSTQRLQRGCEIVSDTYGFAIGETEECKCPTACAGRVLAYPYESLEEFKKYIGYCVCSGPNGTVSIMTDEEEEKYPGRIIGTISEVPTYDKWKVENKEQEDKFIQINGRVWIRVR